MSINVIVRITSVNHSGYERLPHAVNVIWRNRFLVKPGNGRRLKLIRFIICAQNTSTRHESVLALISALLICLCLL